MNKGVIDPLDTPLGICNHHAIGRFTDGSGQACQLFFILFFLSDINGHPQKTFDLLILIPDRGYREFHRAVTAVFTDISPFAFVNFSLLRQGDKGFKVFDLASQGCTQFTAMRFNFFR